MERPIFTVHGRVAHSNGAPAPNTWVSIVDADPDGNDDLLGVGLTNFEGAFRLSFTTEAFNQEPDEAQKLPRLYVVLAVEGRAGPVPVRRCDIGQLAFVGAEDVGTLTLPFLGVRAPRAARGLVHAPGANKRVRRLHLDGEIAVLAAREIAPIVESLTGWSGLLDGVRFEIVDSYAGLRTRRCERLLGRADLTEEEIARVEEGAPHCDALLAAMWDPALRVIVLNRSILEGWSLDALKVTLGHELVHVGQSKRFPKLVAKTKALETRSLQARISGREHRMTPEEWQVIANIEGYAGYIERTYLLSLYTHGRQILSDAALAAAAATQPSLASAALPTHSAPPTRADLECVNGDYASLCMVTKQHQYEVGMAAYLARATEEKPATFDPDLLPELRIEAGILAQLLQRAGDGCPATLMLLGGLYFEGKYGFEKNEVAARTMLQMAADRGSHMASYALALMLPRDDPERPRLLRAAAAWGLADAQTRLGTELLDKERAWYAPEEAKTWLEKAAAHGDRRAMTLLASHLRTGEHFAADTAAADKWLSAAAEGDVPAAPARFDWLVPMKTPTYPQPRELPLSLLIAGELLGREDPRTIDSRPPHEVSRVTFDEIQKTMRVVDTPETRRAWGTIREIVELASTVPNTRVFVLNAGFDDLGTDFEDAPELPKSGLYSQIHMRGYGSLRCNPYGALLYLDPIPSTKLGAMTLAATLEVCARAQAPLVIAPAGSLEEEPLRSVVADERSSRFIHVADPVAVAREMLEAHRHYGLASVQRMGLVDAQIGRNLKFVSMGDRWEWRGTESQPPPDVLERLRAHLQSWLQDRTGDRPSALFRRATVRVDETLVPRSNREFPVEVRYVPNAPLPPAPRIFRTEIHEM